MKAIILLLLCVQLQAQHSIHKQVGHIRFDGEPELHTEDFEPKKELDIAYKFKPLMKCNGAVQITDWYFFQTSPQASIQEHLASLYDLLAGEVKRLEGVKRIYKNQYWGHYQGSSYQARCLEFSKSNSIRKNKEMTLWQNHCYESAARCLVYEATIQELEKCVN